MQKKVGLSRKAIKGLPQLPAAAPPSGVFVRLYTRGAQWWLSRSHITLRSMLRINSHK